MVEAATAPDGAATIHALGGHLAHWRQEQLARRAAFPAAWKAFDRKKLRRLFLKALRRQERR